MTSLLSRHCYGCHTTMGCRHRSFSGLYPDQRSSSATERTCCHCQEDLQRGYWDDFKELRETKGKMFAAPDTLAPADAAPAFPSCTVWRYSRVD